VPGLHKYALFAALLLLPALSLPAQTTNQSGVITGRVVDASETPVKAAEVYVVPLGHPLGTRARTATADATGAFVIDNLTFGTYGVFGKKEDEGYADTLWFSSTEAPRVTISAQQPSGTVVLRFGPKAGMITGTSRDERTGKPVPAVFTARGVSQSKPPNFRVLIPASEDFSLEATAEGYQTWESGPRPLRLEPGAQLHLDIKLKPQPDESRASRFLVPEGYRGRLQLDCGIGGEPAAPRDGSAGVFKFAADGGNLRTSSACPHPGPQNVYFFYSADGSTHAFPDNYWNGSGMIWGEYNGIGRVGVVAFGFFVDTEEEYTKTTAR
jgi:Carboxypeptidase regulatory-like domain